MDPPHVLSWIQFYLKVSQLPLFLSVAFFSPVNETRLIYSTVTSFTPLIFVALLCVFSFVSEHCVIALQAWNSVTVCHYLSVGLS